MGEPLAIRYWCHMCSQVVNPVMGLEIKCPFCESMDGISDEDTDLGTDRSLSLWARILLGMLGTNSRRRRLGRDGEEEQEQEQEKEEEVELLREATELERDLELIRQRRRRSSAAILHMLQGLTVPTGIISESENSETERQRDRERVILINPFNQTIILQEGDSSLDVNQNQNPLPDFLGNYLTGPALELLLQHLMENDPNRYGTPLTQKDAIEALPNVIIKDNLQCPVCLDDFEIGEEAKEMPCKHKFYSGCILPWLELHSSCPVCRFQMPSTDGSKVGADESGNSIVWCRYMRLWRRKHGGEDGSGVWTMYFEWV